MTMMHEAVKAVRCAESLFNEATGNQIDIAVYNLKVAELKLNQVITKVREDSYVKPNAIKR